MYHDVYSHLKESLFKQKASNCLMCSSVKFSLLLIISATKLFYCRFANTVVLQFGAKSNSISAVCLIYFDVNILSLLNLSTKIIPVTHAQKPSMHPKACLRFPYNASTILFTYLSVSSSEYPRLISTLSKMIFITTVPHIVFPNFVKDGYCIHWQYPLYTMLRLEPCQKT